MIEEMGVADKRRYFAFLGDNFFAFILSIITIVIVVTENSAVNVIAFCGAYLGYFFLFEIVVGRTPGKMLMGLTIQKLTGEPCGWQEVMVRTVMRIVETNPILLGGLPAGLAIMASKRKHRLGDMLAKTIVVAKRKSG